MGFPCGSAGKESACNVGDLSSIPGLGRSPGEGKGYPLQYSGLEKSMDCIVHGVINSGTLFATFTFKMGLMLLLSHFIRVQLCATPQTAAHQAPLSMGFSRQEYWSGQPFPSPGHLPNPGIKPRSPALQEDSLPSEPPGKPKNTGMGSLSLLQWIFRTQESNWGLLHCRQILYQLSYQG